MEVSKRMTRLEARVLAAPTLVRRRGKGGGLISASGGSWNLKDVGVAEGATIERWLLVIFADEPGTNTRSFLQISSTDFIKRLVRRCAHLDFELTPDPALHPSQTVLPFRILSDYSQLYTQLSGLTHRFLPPQKPLQLLIFIIPRKTPGYAFLKHICDCHLGVFSQCCLQSKCTPSSNKGIDQYLGNLGLKINAKAGGVTSHLSYPPPNTRRAAVLFLGADVSHAGSITDPAVAAVVGSFDYPEAAKYAARICLQRPKMEIIDNFQEMAGELLGKFKRMTQRTPEKVIMFRDGVSEGQFAQVLNVEVRLLRVAVDQCFPEEGRRPKITWVVVQKRHNTRLFPVDARSMQDKSGNIPAGTVVDHTITHPHDFDFFLCSHEGIKGTSKPTHYHVLYDENNFSHDDMQIMVNKLCCTYARCTRSVSIPPPAFYAHLAAARGWLYFDTLKKINAPAPPMSLSAIIHRNLQDSMFYC